MLPPTEWLLAAALPGIYLFDSVHFLAVGEAVVATRQASLTGLCFGSSFELGGRRPYLPNPLTPWQPELRVDWTASSRGASPEQAAAEMTERLHAVQPIARLASVCAALVAVAAPLALLAGYQGVFAISLLLCFLCAAAGCALVIARRESLGLSLRQAVSTSIVALICLPCSGNLGRAVAIQRRWSMRACDLLDLGFAGTGRAVSEARLRELLTRAQRLCPEDSAEYQSVTAQLRQLEATTDEHH
jgi:hypothetical protein